MKKTHFIGIGGIGMSALAKVLLEKKMEVSGSDIVLSSISEELGSLGAKVHIGHDEKNIPEGATVIYSTGIAKDNPEFLFAIKNHLEVMHRSDLLVSLMEGKKSIAIAGTHGKTTTTSLIASIFTECGLSPSYAVGGYIKQYGTNGHYGKGDYFIAEADESDGTFVKYKPYGAIITNIGHDHMDYFATCERLKEAFLKFLFKVQSHKHLFWCYDNDYLRELNPHGICYGFSQGSTLLGSNFKQNGWHLSLDINYKGQRYKDITAPLVGFHNALNVLGAFGLALESGLSEDMIRKALLSFKGVKRRADVIAEKDGLLFIDDYAHHPTEIEATLRGLKSVLQEKRLVAVYQPHRFSRVKECLGLFGTVFNEADELIVTDIYPAGELPIEGINGMEIVKEIKGASPVPCIFVPQDELKAYLNGFIKKGDAVVFIGAGDISSFGRTFAASISFGKEAFVHT